MTDELLAEILAVLAAAGNVGVDLWLKLQAISELGPDEQANIKAQIQAAIVVDEQVKANYAAWRAKVGLPPA